MPDFGKIGERDMSKMTQKDWDVVRGFTINEKWGDPFMMEKDLLVKLESFRAYVKKPIVIHCGYELSGHSSASQHGLGTACDLHVTGMSLLDQFLAAELFGFNGIGVYPCWNNKGLHLDIRADKITRWWRNDKELYLPLTSQAFKV